MTPGTIELVGSIENKITKDNGENVPHLEITEVMLGYCNVANNFYQQNSKVFLLYSSVPNRSFGQLL